VQAHSGAGVANIRPSDPDDRYERNGPAEIRVGEGLFFVRTADEFDRKTEQQLILMAVEANVPGHLGGRSYAHIRM